MPNFHDPLTQFVVNAVIAVLAIVATAFISIWIYRKQKSKKEISYALVSSAPIVSVKPDVADRIKIYLDGDEITEAQLAVLTIKNTGNTAVKRSDYEEPIVIDFPARKILNGNVLSTTPKDLFKPEDLKTFLEWKGSSVTLAKYLLNPKEQIEFSILVEGSNVEPKVRARIVEGSVVEDRSYQRNRLFSVLLPIILIFPSIALMIASFTNYFNILAPSLLLAILGIISIEELLLSRSKRRK